MQQGTINCICGILSGGSDFTTLFRRRITFTPGGETTQCVPFFVMTDDELEGTEFATVELGVSTTNTNGNLIIGAQDSVLINILDSNGEFV